MTAQGHPWRRHASGLVVRVRVTPKAQRDSIDGIEATSDGPALKVRVRAVPADGAANAAVVKLVAEWLGVAKSTATLLSGAKSRVKSVLISGDGACLEALAGKRRPGP